MTDTVSDFREDQAMPADDPADTGLMFQAAAGGDHDAQAALALNAQQHGLEGLVPIGEAFACAELFARLAASSGEVRHVMTLASVLSARYSIIGNTGLDDGSIPPLEEYYVLMKIAAEAGDADAARNLAVMTDIATVAPTVEAIWSEVQRAAVTDQADTQDDRAADAPASAEAAAHGA